MFVYFLVFVSIALAGLLFSERKLQQLLLIPFILLLIIFAGTRFQVGCDFWGYGMRFLHAPPLDNIASFLQREEPLFLLLTSWVKSVGLEYMWLNLFSSIIIFTCIWRFAARHPSPLLLLALMVPILITQLSMSGLRQAIAVACLMMSTLAYMDKKRLMATLWIILATGFHQTAIIFLPTVFLIGKDISTGRLVLALFILGPVVAFILGQRVDLYRDRYVTQIYGASESMGGVLRYGLLFFTACLFEVYKSRVKQMFPKEYDVMRLYSLMILALSPVILISSVAMHRLGYYMLPVQLYILAIMPIVIPRGSVNFQMVKLMPIILYGVYMLVWFNTSSHADYCYIPYDSYLFH